MSKQTVKNHAPGAAARDVTATTAPPPQTALVNKTTGEITEYNDQDPEVLRSDIIIPYLTIQQGMSDFVQARKAQLGDICKSTDPTKLGDPENPVMAIFLHCPKADWALEQKKDKNAKYKFKKTMERNGLNENLPWNYWSDDTGLVDMPVGAVGATEWRRVKRLSVFAILEGDMVAEKIEKAKLETGDLPDPSKALTPVIISFRVMSYNAGKEISTFYTQSKSMGVNIWRYKMPLGASFESNADNSYYVWAPDRTKARAVSKDDLATVQTWAQIIGSSKGIKVDESGEQSEPERAF